MNFKTTFLLAAAFLGLVLGYTLFRRSNAATPTISDVPALSAPDDVARSVWTDEPGEITKIVCRRKAEDQDWVFEKQTNSDASTQDEWRMTAPNDMPTVRWDVDRIARQLTGLKHDISYKIGDGGLTLEEAGLEPPLVSVTLTDDKGQSVRVDIGSQVSGNTTYVRIDDGEVIYVAKAGLKNLIKSKALDYRDKALWSFDDEKATRVEITTHDDDGDVAYILARSGTQWMFESPVTARATSKVGQMLTSMKNLRVMEWVENRADRLASYGLAPAPVTVRVTVTEEVEVEDKDAEKTETESPDPADAGDKKEADNGKKTEIRTTTYELLLSDRSPIGQETKTYASVGGEAVMGTVSKSIADKFRPVMSEWRDRRITTVAVKSASKIELIVVDGKTSLVKRDGQWFFDGKEEPADASQVSDLLEKISKLEAVAYVDGEVTNPGAFGLDAPFADIRLTIPGVEDVERIAIGGYTDERTKRLMYVRRNQIASVAKVRASEGESLIQPPLAFRDRTVINVPSSRVQSVQLNVKNRFADGRTSVTLERRDDKWTMTTPVEANVRQDEVQGLVDLLSNLQAEAVVGSSDTASSFGLHAPEATVTLTYLPVTSPTEDTAPAPESLQLAVTEHDGKTYAKRMDFDTVYELPRKTYDRLFAEFRVGEIASIDDQKVRRFAIKQGSDEHVFEREDGTWRYKLEPDLPLNQEKVTNLLLQLHDVKTDRFVDYTPEGATSYGLADPFLLVTLEREDGPSVTLSVSDRSCPNDPQNRRYAKAGVIAGVFLLPPDTVDRFTVSLDDLEAD